MQHLLGSLYSKKKILYKEERFSLLMVSEGSDPSEMVFLLYDPWLCIMVGSRKQNEKRARNHTVTF